MELAYVTKPSHHNSNDGIIRYWHTIFGAEIPHLTDFFTGQDEVAGPERHEAILQNGLAHQIAFIQSLHHATPHPTSLALRYWFQPASKRVQLFLLGKVRHDKKAIAEQLAKGWWQQIFSAFPHHLFQLKPILLTNSAYTPRTGQVETVKGVALLNTLLDFPAGNLAEYHRAEAYEHLEAGQSGYVVYPLQGHTGSMHRLLHLLSTQEQPYLISVCLRPTQLSTGERQKLGEVASFCRELASRTERLVTETAQIISIPAGELADLYTNYLRQLHTPYLIRLSVASPSHIPPAILNELASDLAHPYLVGNEPKPNKKGGFTFPQTDTQRRLAHYNLSHLAFEDWQPRSVQPRLAELGRLRHLTDANGLVSCFRIPLPPIGGLPGLDSRPPNLFEALPEMLRRPRPGTLTLGQAHLPLHQLTQHLLIAGTIGSGKTNTAIQLLHQLWHTHRVPFLVIEPVNAQHNDYRSLGHSLTIPTDLRIFTLGDETTSPFRFNPFVVPTGVILNAHIAGLIACFQAALPMGEDSPLPALFREALRRIYFANGWFQDDRGGQYSTHTIPTLPQLRDELASLIEQRYGRKTEVAQTLIGASVTRVNALINSSAGQILMADHSIPLDQLFEHPTILELRHLGSHEDKALMMGFILLALQEYADHNRPVGGQKLNHIVLLEEAHNLMADTDETDTAQAAAVQFFTNMLAENRKYGQGFIIVEQIPTLLAEGAIKNTVTKLMHRLPGRDDITIMGSTMNFQERHNTRAVALQPHHGEALLYATGLNEATLVNIPYFPKDNPLDDPAIQQAMHPFRQQHPRLYQTKLPFDGCQQCTNPCHYRRQVRHLSYQLPLQDQVQQGFYQANSHDAEDICRQTIQPIHHALQALPIASNDRLPSLYCAFLHFQGQLKPLQPMLPDVVHTYLPIIFQE